MIERVHEHIIRELQQNARTDTIFILTAILLNLVTLGVNSGIASGTSTSTRTWIVFATFIAFLLVVNFVALVGLSRGKRSRLKLLDGLLKMYQDQGVAGYYDPSLLSDYTTRYNLFTLAVVFTGLVAVIVPIVLIT